MVGFHCFALDPLRLHPAGATRRAHRHAQRGAPPGKRHLAGSEPGAYPDAQPHIIVHGNAAPFGYSQAKFHNERTPDRCGD